MLRARQLRAFLQKKAELTKIFDSLDYPGRVETKAELPIPNPPNFRLSARNEDSASKKMTTRDISDALQETEIWPNVNTEPSSSAKENIVATVRPDQMAFLSSSFAKFSKSSLADLLRLATSGMRIWEMQLEGINCRIYIRFPENYFDSVEAVAALPFDVGDRIVPLKAIASVRRELAPPVHD